MAVAGDLLNEVRRPSQALRHVEPRVDCRWSAGPVYRTLLAAHCKLQPRSGPVTEAWAPRSKASFNERIC
jgi:hypothetical protein